MARTQRPLWNWCCCSYSLSNIISENAQVPQVLRCSGAIIISFCQGSQKPNAQVPNAQVPRCSAGKMHCRKKRRSLCAKNALMHSAARCTGAQMLCWTKCPVKRDEITMCKKCSGVHSCQVQRCSELCTQSAKDARTVKKVHRSNGLRCTCVQRCVVQRGAPFS